MMKNTQITIRWHSRAGHGAVSAANALAEILGKNNFFVQSFPDFGAEKRGAPVVVYNRISTSPIVDRSHPKQLDFVLLLDTTLVGNELSYEEVIAGLSEEGTLILNTTQVETNFQKLFSGNILHCDASTMSVVEIGKNIPNVPMLGALVSSLDLMPMDQFYTGLSAHLRASGLPEPIVDGNLRAFRRGEEELRIMN